jgi:Cft2 family RNA processing exonuclease
MEIKITTVVNGYVVERKVNDDVKVFAFGGHGACADMLSFLLAEFEPPERVVISYEDKNENWQHSN